MGSCRLPTEVLSHIILFLRISIIKHKFELANHAFYNVATRKGMWFRLYVRDFLTSKNKTTKKPRKRRRSPGQETTTASRSVNGPAVPDRPWAQLYKLRYARLDDIHFGTQSNEAQTAILDLELAETFVKKEAKTETMDDLESMLMSDLEPTATHECGICCKAAVPSKDQFGVFVCPFTGKMFEASKMRLVTNNWDNEYSPFAAEDTGCDIGCDTGCDDIAQKEDVCEDWSRPGVWGRCFAEGYECMTEFECDQMLQRYKRPRDSLLCSCEPPRKLHRL